MGPNIQHAGICSGYGGPVLGGSFHSGPIHGSSVPHGGHVPNEANLGRSSVQIPQIPPFTSTEDGLKIM